MTLRADRSRPRWLRNGAAILALAACGQAGAATYRCDDAGKVTYTNLPCPTGRQTDMRDAPAMPGAEDRAAAASRRRADEAALATLDRERAQARREEQREASVARRIAGQDKRAATCTKLALHAKRVAEDAETAGPKDQSRKRILARRADEDYTTTCRKR